MELRDHRRLLGATVWRRAASSKQPERNQHHHHELEPEGAIDSSQPTDFSLLLASSVSQCFFPSQVHRSTNLIRFELTRCYVYAVRPLEGSDMLIFQVILFIFSNL